MIRIDGAYGEGGGQMLRSALSLSLVTGKPFSIENIRAKRERPGLLRQHLTAVLAAAEVGGAEITGANLGSTSLTFSPGRVKAGDYRFAVGTAGSATLVLQTVLPALMLAEGASHFSIEVSFRLSGEWDRRFAWNWTVTASIRRAAAAYGRQSSRHANLLHSICK